MNMPHAAAAHTGGGGGGANPIRTATEKVGGGAGGDFIPEPVMGGGPSSGAIAQARAADVTERNRAAQKANASEHQQNMQDAMSQYMEARSAGGSDMDIMNRLFGGENGHKLFSNPDAFQTIMGAHKLFQSSAATDAMGAPPSISRIGKYDVMLSGGKATVLNKGGSSAGGHYATGADGNLYFAPKDDPTNFAPVQKGGGKGGTKPMYQIGPDGNLVKGPDGQAVPVSGGQADNESGGGFQVKNPAVGKPKNISNQEENHMNFTRDAGMALAKMQASAGATGSLGYGLIERSIALHTPLSGDAPQAQAYNQGYNELKSAVASMPGGSRLKLALESKLATLPAPGQANAFNVNQAIPAMRFAVRQDAADLLSNLKGQGKDTTVAQKNADLLGADPKYMSAVSNAKMKLQTAPNTLTTGELQVLNGEQRHNMTTGDENVTILKQLKQDGLIEPGNWERLAQKVPELNQIHPSEVRPNPRPWPAPEVQPQPGAAPPSAVPAPAPAAQPAPPPQPAASAPIPPPASAGAPIPPAAPGPQGAAAPQPGAPAQPQQASAEGNQTVDTASSNPLLAGAAELARSLNPVGTAHAEETGPGSTSTAEELLARPGSAPQTGSELSGQPSDVLRETRALLNQTEVRPGVYTPQSDQLGGAGQLPPDEQGNRGAYAPIPRE